MIEALKTLSTGENLETAVNVDEVLRYFTVQVFVMNWDSYLGHTGHNYFLYEENGILSIMPWDYNLAFGTYALGMTNPIKDPNILINYPINTPAEGEVMLNRPLYHNLMKHDEYFARLSRLFRQAPFGIFESGQFAVTPPADGKADCALCSKRSHRLLLLRRPPAGGGYAGTGLSAGGRKKIYAVSWTVKFRYHPGPDGTTQDAKIDASGVSADRPGRFQGLGGIKGTAGCGVERHNRKKALRTTRF